MHCRNLSQEGLRLAIVLEDMEVGLFYFSYLSHISFFFFSVKRVVFLTFFSSFLIAVPKRRSNFFVVVLTKNMTNLVSG